MNTEKQKEEAYSKMPEAPLAPMIELVSEHLTGEAMRQLFLNGKVKISGIDPNTLKFTTLIFIEQQNYNSKNEFMFINEGKTRYLWPSKIVTELHKAINLYVFKFVQLIIT